MFVGVLRGRNVVEGDTGFSLVEVVVAVGIVSIFASLGFVSWAEVVSGRREAYLHSAAGDVMSRAFDWFWDGDVLTRAVDAGDVFNESSRDSTRVSVSVVGGCVSVVAVNDFGGRDERELCVDEGLLDPSSGEVRRLSGNGVSAVVGSDGRVVAGDDLGKVG